VSSTSAAGVPPERFVSAGRLPAPHAVRTIVDEALALARTDGSGALSTVYPALSGADPDLFGVAVASVRGEVVTSGDAEVSFPLMSIAKPFVFALVCDTVGLEEVRRRVGVNATGLAFNSASAVERDPHGRTNPMVNPGAIATTSLVPGADVEERWQRVLDTLSRCAGRHLDLDEGILESARATNHRNRALANLLTGFGALAGDPAEAVEIYTRQSCLAVTSVDLAVMGATLADGGTNPLTGDRVVDPETAHATLAVMTIAGMYETSGDWLLDVGMPAKSGIGGGIVTVSPGKGALGTFSPLLDATGNSVRGTLAARRLSRTLGLDLLASQAVETAP
jgi:glutaminase